MLSNKATTMSDGNRGAGRWFAFAVRRRTGATKYLFLGVLLAVLVVFGTVMWMLLP
jgi:hypothetical protein